MTSINKLADQLTQNYIHVSQRSSDRFNGELIKNIISEDLLKRGFDNHSLVRNILVIGAGASYDSYSGIPLALQAIEMLKMKKRFNTDIIRNAELKEKFIEFASEIFVGYTLEELIEKLDFENWLEVFSKLYSKGLVKKFIQQLYDFRTLPALKYEIIGHLFKHRFVDVIINFNFDELLEQAIEEELGKDNYFSIISDGDCLSLDELMTDNRLKIPIYIKPHGTASHESTLRFTKHSYLNIPDAIEKMIYELVSGRVPKENKNQRIKYVNIITIGFGMGSIEFNKVMRKSISENQHIEYKFYHINRKEPKTDRSESVKDILNEDSISEFIEVTNKLNVDDVLLKLWKSISQNFKAPYKPRAIDRHIIISKLFYSSELRKSQSNLDSTKIKSLNPYEFNEGYYSNGSYYFDRLVAELIIELIKGKGFLDLRKLVSGKVGIYYKLYLKKNKYRNYSLSQICSDNLVLNESFSFGKYLYSFTQPVISKKDFVSKIMDLFKNCDGISTVLKNNIKLNRNDLERNLLVLLSSFTADIKPKFEDTSHLIFDSLLRENVLHTNLSLTATYYDTLMEFESWDLILIVSERGKLLDNMFNNVPTLKEHFKNTRKKVFLITADWPTVFSKDLNKEYFPSEFLVGGKPYKLPYYAHNNHMVIFLKKNKYKANKKYSNTKCSQYRFVRTNYFHKDGLGNNINPIVFDSSSKFETDHQMLLEIFCSYYLKSSGYMNTENLKHITNSEMIDLELSKMLDMVNSATNK